ncbi:MAG TPA: ribonuclease HII [Patescibacteria group bacterium]|nr:ribonuclease HII [Patescibacteria group bacterium]
MSSVIGIDEVGRGCWAGPLVVVAAKAHTELPDGLADSKELTRAQREAFLQLLEATCHLGEGWVTASEIDNLGLTAATKLAVARALRALSARADDEIIMDGHLNYCPTEFLNVRCVIDGDRLHPIVSAASIVAKVRRDRFMGEQAQLFPDYAFEKHVGYGTARHRAALKDFGICELHRKSYKPIKEFLTV